MLEVKNLSYSIENNGIKKDILKNVSFSVDKNKTMIITGHNGSGKSTLLKLIIGIIKPTNGSIYFENKDITNLSITERAKLLIGYAFQTPVCFKGLTVKKLLELACGDDKKNINYYCDILSKMGICARDYLDREVGKQLSGGEQKRIEISSVIARNCKLNLFDEPEAGIDIWSFDRLIDVFKKLNATNIIVSHQKRLMELADKILVLNGGEVEKFGSKEEVLLVLNENSSCIKLRGNNG